jgi:chorismate mutase/prephenate dehydratase
MSSDRPKARKKAPAKAKRAAAPRAATPPEKLGALRERIDTVDAAIHDLLNERARLARMVGISKSRDGHLVDFYRPEREAQVLRLALERNQKARLEGGLRDEEIVRLFREIMSACLAQEEPLKVAFLGPEGTFSQSAVHKHFGHSVRALAVGSIDEVFHEVEAGHADFGVRHAKRVDPAELIEAIEDWQEARNHG